MNGTGHINIKGRTSEVNGENISQNKRKTFLQRRVLTQNGAEGCGACFGAG